MINNITLRVLCGCLLIVSKQLAAAADVKGGSLTDIRKICNQALVNSTGLRSLAGVPLEVSFGPLQRLVQNGGVTADQQARARERNGEAAWLRREVEIGKDAPQTVERAGDVALEVLLGHPELEKFVAAKISALNGRMVKHESDPFSEYSGNDPVEFRYLLYFGERLPTAMAMRLVGPALYSLYFPERDWGDFGETSPAGFALSSLRRLAKARLGEDVPNDIESARAWWTANSSRFALEAQKKVADATIQEPPFLCLDSPLPIRKP